ncbi:abasic site processing protein HMCES-like isoform X2 [Artemia franciscana]|uniref:Abasic site processing protein HMCES n=1 Tax=Artemia franciscana TaxID=6661 RepID=A0AA88HE93_ARTSF|nr:hypothetical protein QYM36_011834 [Artemia franciscana]
MCGRISCTLDPATICKACAYKDKNGKYVKADWYTGDNSPNFNPSVNLAPTMVCPILVSRKHFIPDSSSTEFIVKPMIWGLIPPWHKGTQKDHGLTTNNCRVETIQSKKLYSTPLKKGKRCVVLCDGFYEWKAKKPGDKGPKQPYFICFPQPKSIKIEEHETWEGKVEEFWSAEKGWTGPKPFMMAGLFDKWIDPSNKKPVYSFTVVTMESNPLVSWIHERMPAILESDEQVQTWLDYVNIDESDALSSLIPPSNLYIHPVSPLVNSVKNQDPSLNREIELK